MICVRKTEEKRASRASDWPCETVMGFAHRWRRKVEEQNSPKEPHISQEKLEKLLRRCGQGTQRAVVALSYALWKHTLRGAMNMHMLETQRSHPFHIL
jgi:hypothetical protein